MTQRAAAAWALFALVPVAGLGQEPRPAQATSPRSPRIVVEPAAFDFGEALQDKVLAKEFSVRNFGNAELQVTSVSTTCGCTAALLDSKTLKPGASARLRVTFETRSYAGVLRRSVLIRSNDPAKALLEIRLQAKIRAAASAK